MTNSLCACDCRLLGVEGTFAGDSVRGSWGEEGESSRDMARTGREVEVEVQEGGFLWELLWRMEDVHSFSLVRSCGGGWGVG